MLPAEATAEKQKAGGVCLVKLSAVHSHSCNAPAARIAGFLGIKDDGFATQRRVSVQHRSTRHGSGCSCTTHYVADKDRVLCNVAPACFYESLYYPANERRGKLFAVQTWARAPASGQELGRAAQRSYHRDRQRVSEQGILQSCILLGRYLANLYSELGTNANCTFRC